METEINVAEKYRISPTASHSMAMSNCLVQLKMWRYERETHVKN